MDKRTTLLLICGCAASSIAFAVPNFAGVSSLPEVTASGALRQRVEVSVPSYYNLTPAVGIEQVTGLGNGVVGWGWQLIGGDAPLERTARRTGIPRMDLSDEFVLDGNALIPCSQQPQPGISCNSGGDFGFEHETYQRVKHEGQTWTLWDRDGTRTFYAPYPQTSLPTRWLINGKQDSHGNSLDYYRWCDGQDECYLRQIIYSDAADRVLRTRIEFRWEQRPDPVSYSQRDRLVYVRLRLQSIVVWTNGAVRNALALTYAQGVLGRWSNTSRVKEIKRYGSDVTFDGSGAITGGTRLPAEKFYYEQERGATAISPVATRVLTPQPFEPERWASWHATTDTPDESDFQRWLTLDVNGDGLDDLLAAIHEGPANPGQVKLVVRLNRGDGSFRLPVSQSTPWLFYLPEQYRFQVGFTLTAGDFNGDGNADLLGVWSSDPATGKVFAQVGHGGQRGFALQPILEVPVSKWDDGQRWLVGDIDGDGRDDLIVVEPIWSPTTGEPVAPRVTTLRSDGSTFALMKTTLPSWTDHVMDWPYWFVGDADGDGRVDIIRVSSLDRGGPGPWSAEIQVAHSTGFGDFTFTTVDTGIRNWTPVAIWNSRGLKPLGSDLVKVGDFDGNGLTDLVLFTLRNPTPTLDFVHLGATVALTQPGGGFEFPEQALALGPYRQNSYSALETTAWPNRWLAMDVNHDDVTDLVLVTPPSPVGDEWPQQTLIITLVSNRDGSFTVSSRTANVSFDCWRDSSVCSGGPMFSVLPAELNGDRQSDLLFVLFNEPSGQVELAGELAPRTDPGPLDWRLGDISGDGRIDAVQVQTLGSSLLINSAVGDPGAVAGWRIQNPQTIPVPWWVGLDMSRWILADAGSPITGEPDGRADLIRFDVDLSDDGIVPTRSLVLLSNGDGTFVPRFFPLSLVTLSDASAAWRVGDFNADGRTDLARTTNASGGLRLELALAKGDGSWNYVAGPVEPIGDYIAVAKLLAGDVDGDGRADLVTVDKATHPTGAKWETVIVLRTDDRANVTPQMWDHGFGLAPQRVWTLADINGDARPDWVAVVPGPQGPRFFAMIGVGGGNSWEPLILQAPNIAYPPPTQSTLRVLDVNRDGCADLGWVSASVPLAPKVVMMVNNCAGALDWHESPIGTGDRWTTAWQTGDLAGDGRDDFVALRLVNDEVMLSGVNLMFARPLLIASANGIGLEVNVGYATSAGSHAVGPTARPPFVVASIRNYMPTGSVNAVTSYYKHRGALWSPGARVFLGFKSVSVLAGSTITETHYSQTAGCAMRPERIAIGNAQGVFWADTSSYYDSSTPAWRRGPWICELEKTTHVECELSPSCRDTAVVVRYYDEYGNVVRSSGIGDPLDPGDDRQATAAYFPAVGQYLVNYPAKTETRDSRNLLVTSTQLYYDGATAISVPPTTGDVTRMDSWDSISDSYVTAHIEYDLHGNPTANIDAEGRTHVTLWDPTFARFPVVQCNDLWCEHKDWDLRVGVPIRVSDANQRVTASAFDALGRHERTVYPDGGCVLHRYLDWGASPPWFLTQRILEARCTLPFLEDRTPLLWHSTYFDGLQRTWKEERSGGYEMRALHDGGSDRIAEQSYWKVSGAPSIRTVFKYDDAHRLSRVVLPDHAERSLSYDIGYTVEQTPKGGRREEHRDGWQRVESVAIELRFRGSLTNAVTCYEYDALDRLYRATDPNGNVTTWDRSSLGWLYHECDPDRRCRGRTFDRTGILKSETAEVGSSVEYDLDQLGRHVHRRTFELNGAIVGTASWTFDVRPQTGPSPRLPKTDTVGRLVEMSSSDGVLDELSYDSTGRVDLQRRCVGTNCVASETKWDPAGRPSLVRYPDASGNISAASESVPYSYDVAGRLQQVGSYVTDILYTPDDLVTELHLGNGVTQTTVHNPLRRWVDSTQIIGPLGPGSVGNRGLIIADRYEYNPDGTLKLESRGALVSGQRPFAHDNSGRLTDVFGAQPDHIDYDLAGNILQRTALGRYDYTDLEHPNAVTAAGSHVYSYDRSGRMGKRDGYQVHWDPLDRLVAADTPTGSTTFTYGAGGDLAVITNSNGERVIYGPLVENDGFWGPFGQIFNFRVGGQVVAQRSPAWGIRYLHHDRLGSVSAITNSNGSAIDLYRYDPWGISTGTGGMDNDLRFAGGREESTSGLIVMGSRAVDPVLGRFVSPDSIVPDPFRPPDLNRYIYALNDPVDMTDPSGHAVAGQAAAPDELSPLANATLDYLARALASLEEEVNRAVVRWVVPRDTRMPGDPETALEAIGNLIEGTFPGVTLLSLPVFRQYAKGVGVNASFNSCFLVCLLSADFGAGLYLSPPSANDKYFSEMHPYLQFGGSFLGVSPHSGADFASPDIGSSSAQLNPGVSAGFSGSVSGFLSSATTKGSFEHGARSAGISLGSYTSSYSENSAGQWTVSMGRGISVPTGVLGGAQVYNTYTVVFPSPDFHRWSLPLARR